MGPMIEEFNFSRGNIQKIEEKRGIFGVMSFLKYHWRSFCV
jgi:hypothetical protein